MSDFRVVGQEVPRQDAFLKATGQAVYGVDVTMPRMLVGKILRSPVPHARISGIDVTRARDLPGVKAVVTAADFRGRRFGFLKATDPRYADRSPLQGEKVRYVGDEVAAVAAVDEETARKALNLIRVDYEELPPVFDPREAMRAGAPQLHAEAPGNVLERFEIAAGSWDEAVASADCIVEETYTTNEVTAVCLEPHQAVAYFEPEGQLVIHSSIQMPFLLRRDLADVLGLSESDVRVIRTHVGGGFGSRMEMQTIEPICAELSRLSGRPVKIVNSRQEEFIGTRCRHPLHITVRAAARRDGTLLGLFMDVTADSGAYCSQAPAVTRVALVTGLTIYQVPNVKGLGTIVYTNKPYGGAMRGFGNPQACFAVESCVDLLASELGIDPLELRLLNAHQPGEVTALGQRIGSCGQSECLRRAARLVGWEQRGQSGAPAEGQRVVRGLGLASYTHVGGGARDFGSDGCGAFVKIADDGRVTVITGAQEIGQGADTVMAQIVSETLGIPFEWVRVENNDTNLMPWDTGAHAQRTTFIGGNAVLLAAQDAREQLVAVASAMLGIPPKEVRLQDGYARSPVGQTELSFANLVRRHHHDVGGGCILGKAHYEPPSEHVTSGGNNSGAYSYGATAAEVEVDLDSGAVRVLKVVAALDAGQVINPLGLRGQVEGAVAQGVGYALYEVFQFDGQGNMVNANLHDYRLPTVSDMPDVITTFVETAEPNGPYGAKGAGEAIIAPVAPTVVNAIRHATGIQVTDLPVTPEVILRATGTLK